MDVRDGRIYSHDHVRVMPDEVKRHMIEMQVAPTPLQMNRGRVGRNDPCPCGSGRKFKKCHLEK